MKILLSNDDGVFAAGIQALAAALSAEHEVFVSAPDRERSAASNSMTLSKPLFAAPVSLPGLSGVPARAVSGTPVDCVRLGVGNLFPEPDMVVSGINHGGNLGTDTLYSGTVAAAFEAALLGIPAIAMSCCAFHPQHLETSGFVARKAVQYLTENPLPFGCVLSVNVPDLPLEALRGVRTAPVCIKKYVLQYIERLDPGGKPYYWCPRGNITEYEGLDVDERWAREGYVTVTPLTYDLTAYNRMRDMRVETLLEQG